MDSKVVNQAIRAVVWPILRDHGFSVFTGRSAWRNREGLTDVVNFQSFNRYNADVLGCSTFSFAINLGLFIVDARDQELRARSARPDEAECHIRRRLSPERPELEREPDIWVIDRTGTNIESTVQSAALQLVEVAVPWFDVFQDREAVLRVLLGERKTPDGATRLPGNPGSERLNLTIGLLAQALGDQPLSGRYLQRAAEQQAQREALFASLARGYRKGRV